MMATSSDDIRQQMRGESAFWRMDPRITFVSAMPRPSGAWTSIQGFSRERVELHWIWRAMLGLPSTVYQLAAPIEATIGIRACGMAGWRHLPVRVDRLLRARVHEGSPLWVVFSGDRMVAELVGRWSAAQSLRPLHVSAAEVDGAIRPAELTAERLRQHWLQLVADSGGRLDGLDDLLAGWRTHEVVTAAFPFLGHQTVTPNQECLEANGVVGDGFVEHWRGSTEQDFDEAIKRTFDAVMALHSAAPAPASVRLMPPRPTTWLVAPAWVPDLRRRLMDGVSAVADMTAVSALANRIERQRSFVVGDDPRILEGLQASPKAMRLHETRRLELGLFSDAIGWAIAGTAAGAWRMRPSINMVHGRVRQFAENVRSEARTPHAKMGRLFEAIQTHLLEAVGAGAVEAVRAVDWGVKIVSDAPVEWLPVGRLPLGLHCDVSRVTATPADLLLRQLETHEMLRIGVSDFDEVLLVSTFEEGRGEDVIKRLLDQVFNIKRIRLRLRRVATEADLVREVNGYDGPLMIFDGHGAHPRDDEAHLLVGTERVRVAALEGRIRLPPIVVLSACDTHAAGRSTRTVANSMLRLGARTVLATNLPVRFDQAAVMAGDLVRTIDAYLPSMPGDIGRVVRWSEFVGGLLRAHFIMGIVLRLVDVKALKEEETTHFLPGVLLTARFRTGTRALAQLEDELVGRGVVDAKGFDSVVRQIVSTSDSIRYVQLGNPETIVIGTIADLPPEQREQFAGLGPATPVWKLDGDAPAGVIDVMEALGQAPYGPWRGGHDA